MITLKIEKLEKILGKKIRRKCNVLGVDTASRTGYAKIYTTDKTIKIDYGYIDVKNTDIYFKYDTMIEMFNNILKEKFDKVIIEDTYLKFYGKFVQANGFKQLSRIGMIVYVLAKLNNMAKEFINANSSRTNIGLNGKAKKEEVHKQFQSLFNINIDDPDIVDSIILGFNGVIEKESIFNE